MPKMSRRASSGPWHLEPLEARTLLAIIAWDGGPSGLGTNWHDPINWVGDVLPTSTDEAVITVAGSPTISISQSASVLRLTCDEAISITGDLSVAAASVVSGAATLAGSLSGAGDIVFAGGLAWVGGSMTGTGKTTVPAGATLDVSGSAHDLARTLESAGSGQWSSGAIRYSGGTLLNSGTLTVIAASPLQSLGVAGVNALANSGTLIKQGAAELLIAGGAAGVSLVNTGSLVLAEGSLHLAAGGQTSTLLTVPATTSLLLGGTMIYSAAGGIAGAGSVTFLAGTHVLPTGQFTPTGAVDFAGGSVTIANPFSPAFLAPIAGSVSFLSSLGYSGALTVTGSAAFAAAQSFASLSLSGTLAGAGDITITGGMSWISGAMSGSGRTIIAPTATLDLSSPSSRTLSRTLVNNGTATWTDGVLAFASGTITNNASFTASTAAALSAFGNSGVNAFTNAGTFTKLGPGSLSIGVNVTAVALNNSGTVNVNSGTLFVAGGGSNSSLINVPAPAEAVFSASFTHAAGGTLSGAGTITFTGGVHSLPAGTFAPVGTLNLTGGTITLNGSIAPASLGAIGATVTFAAALSYTGPLTVAGSASFALAQTLSSLTLTGTISGAGDLTITGALDWQSGSMTGTGRTIIAPAAQLLLASGATRSLARTLTNNGSASWTSGSLSFASGTFTNNGSFVAATDSTLTASGASGTNAFTNAGAFTKSGAGICQFIVATTGVAFNHTGSISLLGGTLVLGAGGSASAPLPIGSAATLAFAGNYAINPGATIFGTGTVSFQSGTISIPAGLFLPTGVVNFSGGTVTIANSFSPASLGPITGIVLFNAPQTFASLTLAGTLGGSGNITITGALDWRSGTMSGTGRTILPVGSNAAISTPAVHALSRAIDLAGAATWTDGDLAFASGSLNLASTASLSIASNSLLRAYGSSGTNSIANLGQIAKSGVGEARIDVSSTAVTLANQSGGMIDVLAGTLTLAGGGTNLGAIVVAATGTLNLAATYTHGATGTIAGAGRATFSAGTHTLPAGAFLLTGTLDLTGGTVTFADSIAPTTLLPIAGAATFNGALAYTGDLTITGSATFALAQSFASMTLAGTLGGAGSVTVLGSLTWTSGSMAGAGSTTAAGSLSLAGGARTLGRVLNLLGPGTWTAGDLTLNGGELRIDASASLDVDNATALSVLASGAGGKVSNLGTFAKSGTAALVFSSAAPGAMLESSGTLHVNAGTLNLGGGGTLDGSASVASGATLTLSASFTYATGLVLAGLGTVNFSGGTHSLPIGVTPSGTINFNSGTIAVTAPLAPAMLGTIAATVSFAVPLTYSGAITVTGSASFAQAQTISTLTLSGTLTGAGDVSITTAATWSAGSMSGAGITSIDPGATLTISGSAHTLARSLIVRGSATWTGGAINFTSATLRNESSFTINTSGTLVASGTGSFDNLGTLAKLGSGDAQLAVALNHSGTVNFQAGTLTLSGGGTLAAPIEAPTAATLVLAGSPTYAPGAHLLGAGTITFNGGTHSIGVGQFTPTGTVNFSAGTISIAGALSPASLGTIAAFVSFAAALNYTGALTITGSASFAANQTFASLTVSGTLAGAGTVTVLGAFNWTGGTLAGSGRTIVGPAGTLAISTAPHNLSRWLVVQGTGTWSAGNITFADGTFEIAQGASLSVTTTGTMSAHGSAGVNSIINRGTFTKIGTGTVQTTAANAAIVFDNQGTVQVNSNTLSLLGPVLQVNGDTLTGGTWIVADACTLNLPAGVAIRTSNATIRLAGSTSAFPAIAGLTTNNGSLTLADGRAFNFSPLGNAFLNAGVLTKSGTGSITIAASITLNNVGLLAVTGGTVTLNGPITQLVAGLLGGGSWFVGTNATLTMTGATITTSSAVVTLSGVGSTFIAFNSMRTSTNSLTVTAGRNFTLPNLTASGKLTVGAGSTLNVTGAFSNAAVASIAGTINATGGGSSSGRFELSAGGVLSLSGGHTLSTSAAVVGDGSLALGAGTQSIAAPIAITGVLSLTAGSATLSSNAAAGQATIAGGLTLGASILSLAGPATFTPSSSLSFRAESPSLFGRITSPSALTLDGMLALDFAPGFVPAAGSLFPLLSGTSRTGTFASLLLGTPGAGLTPLPRYLPAAFAVAVSTVAGQK
ncbi:MAG: hypothetical protein JNM80_11460 [Phycisphaerae bacterium]|nr:hypothetical protein [Phycisphaerae bacterium]